MRIHTANRHRRRATFRGTIFVPAKHTPKARWPRLEELTAGDGFGAALQKAMDAQRAQIDRAFRLPSHLLRRRPGWPVHGDPAPRPGHYARPIVIDDPLAPKEDET